MSDLQRYEERPRLVEARPVKAGGEDIPGPYGRAKEGHWLIWDPASPESPPAVLTEDEFKAAYRPAKP